MEINDKMTIDLEGIGEATATAVKKEGERILFVFDGTIGNSNMDNMDNFLSNLATKFPQPLQDRLEEIRLLDASEVFSDCDSPEWEWLLQHTKVKMENLQIPYFKSVYHRRVEYTLNEAFDYWWLCSAAFPSRGFVIVNSCGDALYNNASFSSGVRPLFVLKDKED